MNEKLAQEDSSSIFQPIKDMWQGMSPEEQKVLTWGGIGAAGGAGMAMLPRLRKPYDRYGRRRGGLLGRALTGAMLGGVAGAAWPGMKYLSESPDVRSERRAGPARKDLIDNLPEDLSESVRAQAIRKAERMPHREVHDLNRADFYDSLTRNTPRDWAGRQAYNFADSAGAPMLGAVDDTAAFLGQRWGATLGTAVGAPVSWVGMNKITGKMLRSPNKYLKGIGGALWLFGTASGTAIGNRMGSYLQNKGIFGDWGN